MGLALKLKTCIFVLKSNGLNNLKDERYEAYTSTSFFVERYVLKHSTPKRVHFLKKLVLRLLNFSLIAR